MLLEQAEILIAHEYGSKPSIEAIENALRNGKDTILLARDRVELKPYLQKASESLASVTATSIQKSLRVESMSPDVFLLVGGGAPLFDDAIQGAFPKLKVVTPKDPVLANARGFWLMDASA